MSEVALPETAPAELAVVGPAEPDLANLFAALSAAQGKIQAAELTRENPHLKTRYATLAAVWEACRGPLSENGLTVLQLPTFDGARVYVETILAHKSGQRVSTVLGLAPGKLDAQGVGSAITYCRRYALSSLVGVCPDDDDDGTLASQAREGPGRGNAPQAPPPPQQSKRGRPTKAEQAAQQAAQQQTTTGAMPSESPHKQARAEFFAAALNYDGVIDEKDPTKVNQTATRAAVIARLKDLAARELIEVDTAGIGDTGETLTAWLDSCTAAQLKAITATYRAEAQAEREAADAEMLEAEFEEKPPAQGAAAVVADMFEGLPQ